MRIIVIVITFNGSKWVDSCFGSLIKSSIPIHVLAIDNASTDDTVKFIKERFRDVEVIETGSNLGFGRANNIGIKRALELGADYFFLMNQDVWVETDTLKILQQRAEQSPEYGIISPFHLLPDRKALEWHFSTYIAPEKCKDLYSDIYFDSTKDIYPLEFVNAAAWFMSRNTIEKVGGFDPIFPHYGEDDDYCNRTIFHGLKIGVAPQAKIVHDINMKSWELIKFDERRQLIFCFIELKNIRYSLKYLLLIFIMKRTGELFRLLLLRKWKELAVLTKVFFQSWLWLPHILKSRRESKTVNAYLK